MTADDTLARQRYATVSRTIPDRLDQVAHQLEDILALVARYGLAEALQPTTGPHQHVSVQELRDAATRISTAADHFPRTSCPPQPLPGTPPAAPGAGPAHATVAGS